MALIMIAMIMIMSFLIYVMIRSLYFVKINLIRDSMNIE